MRKERRNCETMCALGIEKMCVCNADECKRWQKEDTILPCDDNNDIYNVPNVYYMCVRQMDFSLIYLWIQRKFPLPYMLIWWRSYIAAHQNYPMEDLCRCAMSSV